MQKSSLKFCSLWGQCAARHQPSQPLALPTCSAYASAAHGHCRWTRKPPCPLCPQKQLSFSHSSVLMYNKLQATRGQHQERESRKRMPRAVEAGSGLFVWGITETQEPSLQELCSAQQTHHFSPTACPSCGEGNIPSR